MENRKKLHDYGLIMILFGVLDLVTCLSYYVPMLISGKFPQELLEHSDVINPSVVVYITIALTALLVLADAFLGMKALKVSKNPTADKGYIIATMVFFVFSIVIVILGVIALFGAADIFDKILDLLLAVSTSVIYFLFMQAANAVRNDVINEK